MPLDAPHTFATIHDERDYLFHVILGERDCPASSAADIAAAQARLREIHRQEHARILAAERSSQHAKDQVLFRLFREMDAMR